MELRQLRYFVAVAETGNISRAAKTLFLTQPALSRQIRALEEHLGQRLFDRRAHAVELTAAGVSFLSDARALVHHAGEVEQRARAAARGVWLRVGYAPSLASGILSAAVASFSQAHPEARVELFDLSTAEMFSGLAACELDVVLTAGGNGEVDGVCWTPLVRTSWQLAVSREHPLASRAQISPAEVAAQSLLVFCQSGYPEYRETIQGWLRDHGLCPAIAGEYDGVESLMAAVEAGLGVAVVTAGTAKLFPSRGVLRPLEPAPPPLCVAAGHLATRAQDKPLAVLLAEFRKAAQAFG
jgi:DNA-binding transcriptional LysR family regulator